MDANEPNEVPFKHFITQPKKPRVARRQPFPRPFSVSQIRAHDTSANAEPAKPILNKRIQARMDSELADLIPVYTETAPSKVRPAESFVSLNYGEASASNSTASVVEESSARPARPENAIEKSTNANEPTVSQIARNRSEPPQMSRRSDLSSANANAASSSVDDIVQEKGTSTRNKALKEQNENEANNRSSKSPQTTNNPDIQHLSQANAANTSNQQNGDRHDKQSIESADAHETNGAVFIDMFDLDLFPEFGKLHS